MEKQPILLPHRKLVHLGGQLPLYITQKAIQLCDKIASNTFTLSQLKGKRLTRNRNYISYSISKNYRVVVKSNQRHYGPYLCLSHADYNHWLKKI